MLLMIFSHKNGSPRISDPKGTILLSRNNRVVEVEAAAEDNENANLSQKDDGADIRRWKGLKQDEDTGKFVVYITEQEERVFDTPEEALSFMMRE